jgi:acyl-CoA hydrolase
MTRVFDDVGEAVEATLSRVGNRVVLATPLGIGKPNALLNEFYRRAARNPDMSLRIVTALSLSRPRPRGDLHARFLGPLNERLFPDYVELDYVAAQRAGRLPPNVTVSEFYVDAGGWLGVPAVQQHYLSTNYTHVVRDLLALGVNVIAQSVAARHASRGTEYSLSANPDLTLDLLDGLAAARNAGAPLAVIGAINRRMPFMLGDAVVPEDSFDFIVDHPRYEHEPYGALSLPIGTADYCIGLHASALVRDGGTLQLGIGELADAVVYGLQLRQQRNAQYRAAHAALGFDPTVTAAIGALGGLSSLDRGVYGCSEMFVDGFLDLYRTGVLKRGVHAHARLQRLLDDGLVSDRIDAGMLEALASAGTGLLTQAEFAALRDAGLFIAGTRLVASHVECPDGMRVLADLGDSRCRTELLEHACGRRLGAGTLLHAGFLLGPRGFYSALRDLPETELARFAMTRISFTNQLIGADTTLRIAQRRHARFINSTMLVSALGAATSDALATGQVVSGVGGQYNFVAMAHELAEARSVLMLRSTRTRQGETTSNVVWSYGHVTIPRHLRDVIVTEYGIADLRGKTDRECVVAMLSIADSRFQEQLLTDAKRAGKIESGYRLPDALRANLPDRLGRALEPLRRAGLFTDFPFGTDFTGEEIVLMRAMKRLETTTTTWWRRSVGIAQALFDQRGAVDAAPYLARLGLDRPQTFGERILAALVRRAVITELGAADG